MQPGDQVPPLQVRLQDGRLVPLASLHEDGPLVLFFYPKAFTRGCTAESCHFRDLAAEGRTVLASIHDLGLAARFCTRLVLLSGGHVLADGAADAVLGNDLVRRAFGITLRRIDTPDGPAILPV